MMRSTIHLTSQSLWSSNSQARGYAQALRPKKRNPRFLNLCKAPIDKQKSLTHHNKMGIFTTLDILQTTNLIIESVVQVTTS